MENENVKRWYESMRKQSRARAGVYFRLLSRFCENYAKMSSWEFAKLTKRKMEDITMDYVTCMENNPSPVTKKPYSPAYIGKFVDAISSWARWNSKRFERQISITNPKYNPTAESERVPTPDELRRVLYAPTTHLPTRVVIALIAFSGAPFITYGDYDVLDGLKVKDFPELKIATDADGRQKEATFEKVPTFVVVRANLSKSGLEYRTQLAEEGVEILKQWLDNRILSGEILGPGSGIIVTTAENRARLRVPLGDGLSDVCRVSPLCDKLVYFQEIISLVHAHVLRMFLGGHRPLHLNVFERWFCELHVVPVRATYSHSYWHSISLNEQASFCS